MALLEDLFTTLDTSTKWTEGTKSLNSIEDLALTVQASGGLLEIVPLASTSGSHYDGIFSQSLFDPTDTTVVTEAVQPQVSTANFNNVTRFGWVKDENNWWMFQVSSTELNCAWKESGVQDDGTALTYSNPTHRWLRLRHDGLQFHYETSSDGSNWTDRRQRTPGVSISASRVEFVAGTSASYASPSTVQFDNLNLSLNEASSPALVRGRNYLFFDDDEVNRFEFWPVVSQAVIFERSAAISATADIESSATFFTVFQSAVTIDAITAIESSGVFYSLFDRAVAVDALTSISVSGLHIAERTALVSTTADISVSSQFFSILSASVVFSVTATIESSAEAFTLVERSVEFDSTASVDVSGQGFSVFESATTISATATIGTVAEFFTTVERSVAVDGTAIIATTAQFFSIVERQVMIEGLVAVAASGEFFTVLERQASLTAVADIAASGIEELSRLVEIVALAAITVSGQVVPISGEHERAVAVDALGDVQASAFAVLERPASVNVVAGIAVTGLSVHERQAAIAADAVIESGPQRELLRLVELAATADISASGFTVPIGIDVFERSVAINVVAGIRAGRLHVLAPPRRVYMIESPQRVFEVRASNRVYVVIEPQREADVLA